VTSALAERPTLEIDDVVVEYHRKRMARVRAVAGATISVSKGQVHGLVGESGCGKSSLARAATGLVPVASGSIHFEGHPVSPLTRRRRPAHLRRLQMVFQDPQASLNPRRTVGDQLSSALRRSAGVASAQRPTRIRELLDTVGLPTDAATRLPGEFSGGQRQRVGIARALAADPKVIIADEPISALDASAQAQIANLLVTLARELDLGILFISHDLAIVRHVADVVTVMYLGTVVESAPTKALWDEPYHPYSEALIAAAPEHDGSGVVPRSLPGEIPDPASPPTGCRFHPRCAYAFERCPSDVPPLFALAPDRRSACWLQDAGPIPIRRHDPHTGIADPDAAIGLAMTVHDPEHDEGGTR
jgi:oligopeptide/dipeptide ABC transporter ATP-binding protein